MFLRVATQGDCAATARTRTGTSLDPSCTLSGYGAGEC